MNEHIYPLLLGTRPKSKRSIHEDLAIYSKNLDAYEAINLRINGQSEPNDELESQRREQHRAVRNSQRSILEALSKPANVYWTDFRDQVYAYMNEKNPKDGLTGLMALTYIRDDLSPTLPGILPLLPQIIAKKQSFEIELNTTLRDDKGYTALTHAVKAGNPTAVATLLTIKARSDIKTKPDPVTKIPAQTILEIAQGLEGGSKKVEEDNLFIRDILEQDAKKRKDEYEDYAASPEATPAFLHTPLKVVTPSVTSATEAALPTQQPSPAKELTSDKSASPPPVQCHSIDELLDQVVTAVANSYRTPTPFAYAYSKPGASATVRYIPKLAIGTPASERHITIHSTSSSSLLNEQTSSATFDANTLSPKTLRTTIQCFIPSPLKPQQHPTQPDEEKKTDRTPPRPITQPSISERMRISLPKPVAPNPLLSAIIAQIHQDVIPVILPAHPNDNETGARSILNNWGHGSTHHIKQPATLALPEECKSSTADTGPAKPPQLPVTIPMPQTPLTAFQVLRELNAQLDIAQATPAATEPTKPEIQPTDAPEPKALLSPKDVTPQLPATSPCTVCAVEPKNSKFTDRIPSLYVGKSPSAAERFRSDYINDPNFVKGLPEKRLFYHSHEAYFNHLQFKEETRNFNSIPEFDLSPPKSDEQWQLPPKSPGRG